MGLILSIVAHFASVTLSIELEVRGVDLIIPSVYFPEGVRNMKKAYLQVWLDLLKSDYASQVERDVKAKKGEATRRLQDFQREVKAYLKCRHTVTLPPT